METTQPEHNANEEWPELPGDCPIYRAVINRPGRDKVTGEILRGAFLRRPPKEDGTKRDVNGLSVFLYIDDEITEEGIIEHIRSSLTCYAIGKLYVQPVRDIETDPKLDVIRDRKNHADIKGLPEAGEDDIKAERLAGKLARIAGNAIWWDGKPTTSTPS